MSNITLENIYNNLNLLIEDFKDFPETEEAENSFWEFVKQNILENSEPSMEFENALYEVAYYNQRQGFMYAMQFISDLLNFR